jgi:hypothetical protein
MLQATFIPLAAQIFFLMVTVPVQYKVQSPSRKENTSTQHSGLVTRHPSARSRLLYLVLKKKRIDPYGTPHISHVPVPTITMDHL